MNLHAEAGAVVKVSLTNAPKSVPTVRGGMEENVQYYEQKLKKTTPCSLEAVALQIVIRNDTEYINHTL
jgi:hypothetical protein